MASGHVCLVYAPRKRERIISLFSFFEEAIFIVRDTYDKELLKTLKSIAASLKSIDKTLKNGDRKESSDDKSNYILDADTTDSG